ncbi:lytic murein transglycosylase [Rhizobiales bacterium]|uniref:lytic murein transglycosylase n=1 Tax=Hongsoonwoonella zoysiae TaxID=2821844 RepID=UPI001561567A|nr:lytic murein transglycosylase [Hongsoonwoonella zoysiae]NRG16786.1 lytic murein transglycosylase [Hongsoonwoonella zoysiae]
MSRFVAALAILAFASLPAFAASCGNDSGGFGAWLEDFKRRAVASGVSPRTVQGALNGVSYDRKVIRLDRSQKSFKLSFDQFRQRRAPAGTIALGRRQLRNNQRLLSSIENSYGVAPEILVAIWGLESGFGRFSGNMSVFRSLATLAYDCRRSEFFTEELYAALVIADRGYMSPSAMVGAWAGELGQTQFLASNYVRYAVDYDRDGRRDLIRSRADVLASTANYLRQKGWRPGGDWSPGTRNYAVLKEWNRAEVYRQTIAYFATELRR